MITEHEFISKLVVIESPFVKPHLLWNYSLSTGGHGSVYWGSSRRRASHVMWFLTYGKWPDNQLNHLCDLPACVEPFHVYDGTQKENQQDQRKKPEFQCGHSKTPANSYRNGGNSIACRTCKLTRKRKKWNDA